MRSFLPALNRLFRFIICIFPVAEVRLLVFSAPSPAVVLTLLVYLFFPTFFVFSSQSARYGVYFSTNVVLVYISRGTYGSGYNEIHLKSHRAPYSFSTVASVVAAAALDIAVVVLVHNYTEPFNLHKIPNEAFITLAACESRK